jgi:hypothetical protein
VNTLSAISLANFGSLHRKCGARRSGSSAWPSIFNGLAPRRASACLENASPDVEVFIPCVAAVIDDIAVGSEDEVREPVFAHLLPDIFNRIEFRAFRRQRDNGDIGGNGREGRRGSACVGVACAVGFGPPVQGRPRPNSLRSADARELHSTCIPRYCFKLVDGHLVANYGAHDFDDDTVAQIAAIELASAVSGRRTRCCGKSLSCVGIGEPTAPVEPFVYILTVVSMCVAPQKYAPSTVDEAPFGPRDHPSGAFRLFSRPPPLSNRYQWRPRIISAGRPRVVVLNGRRCTLLNFDGGTGPHCTPGEIRMRRPTASLPRMKVRHAMAPDFPR